MFQIILVLLLPRLAVIGMPTSLHVITMYPFGLIRTPSQNTVCDAKKFVLSWPMMEAIAKGPARGDVHQGDDHAARVRDAALKAVDAHVSAEERDVVSGLSNLYFHRIS